MMNRKTCSDHGVMTMSEAGIEIEDGEFYHLNIDDDETVFATQEEAVDHIREHKDDIDLEDPEIRLAAVETGDEWAIEGVAWQTIALQLL